MDEHDCQAELRIYNIRDGNSGEKPGFKSIKSKAGRYGFFAKKRSNLPFLTRFERFFMKFCQNSSKGVIRIMVAGGDGTVMWVISELAPHGINVDDVFFQFFHEIHTIFNKFYDFVGGKKCCDVAKDANDECDIPPFHPRMKCF